MFLKFGLTGLKSVLILQGFDPINWLSFKFCNLSADSWYSGGFFPKEFVKLGVSGSF